MLALYALVLQALLSCSLVANATPYAPLTGAPSGYVVEARAPPGSRLLLYPAPGAPPVPLAEAGAAGGCTVYRAGPLALSPGAYIEARLPDGGEARLALRLPQGGGAAATVTPVYTVGGNFSRILVSSAGKHGVVGPGYRGVPAQAATAPPTPAAAAEARPGSPGKGVDTVTLAGAVLLLLAWLVLRLLSARGGRLGGVEEGL